MFCSTCGRQVAPDARFCDNCGAAVTGQQAGGPQYAPGMPYPGEMGYGAPVNIPNYLVQAIVLTIFGAITSCCYFAGLPTLITGIVAIVYASQVNGRVQIGDIDGALDSSGKARAWCWVSFGILIVGIVLMILLFSILGFSSIMNWL